MGVPRDSCMLHQVRSAEFLWKRLHLRGADAIILRHLAEDPAVSLWSECVCVTLCNALQKYLSWFLINPVWQKSEAISEGLMVSSLRYLVKHVLSFHSEKYEKWKRQDCAFLLLSLFIPIRYPNYHLLCKILLNLASKAQWEIQVRNVELAIRSLLINQGHSNNWTVFQIFQSKTISLIFL